jgi:hypothetical protein
MRISLLAVPAIVLCAMCSTANAQSAPPPGPYTESCRDIEMRGTTLTATCKASSGKWEKTRLKNADKCSDGVANTDATLVCRTGLLPPGSYVSTCDNVRLEGTTLKANCNNSKGKAVATELRNANQCTADIANHEGVLKCLSGPQPVVPEKLNLPEEKKKKKRFVIF